MRILVLYGGGGSERDVSLKSGAAVASALEAGGFDVKLLDPSTGTSLAEECLDIDAVFPILHGRGGEDGIVQKQLESIGVPFLGSGSKACENTFNKDKFKLIMLENGVPVPNGVVVSKHSFRNHPLRQRPYVLKPVDGGSSVDTLIVRDVGNQPTNQILEDVFRCNNDGMLLEELIIGQELTVGVFDNEALPIILIRPPEGAEFDYDNKYNGKTAEIVDPEEVSVEAKKLAQELALKVHKLTNCRHLSRADMILDEAGELHVLEINTIPGMTGNSLYPKMAAKAGLLMPALMERFTELALIT